MELENVKAELVKLCNLGGKKMEMVLKIIEVARLKRMLKEGGEKTIVDMFWRTLETMINRLKELSEVRMCVDAVEEAIKVRELQELIGEAETDKEARRILSNMVEALRLLRLIVG